MERGYYVANSSKSSNKSAQNQRRGSLIYPLPNGRWNTHRSCHLLHSPNNISYEYKLIHYKREKKMANLK